LPHRSRRKTALLQRTARPSRAARRPIDADARDTVTAVAADGARQLSSPRRVPGGRGPDRPGQRGRIRL